MQNSCARCVIILCGKVRSDSGTKCAIIGTMLTTQLTPRGRLVSAMNLSLVALLMVIAETSATSQESPRPNAPSHRITFGVFDPRPNPSDSPGVSSLRGVTLGIEEARLTAQLFGWEVSTVRHPDSLSAEDALRFLERAKVTAIVGNLTAGLQNSREASEDAVMIDVEPRRFEAGCGDRRFHVLPMVDSAVAWDSSLERFGAAQLNQRYQRRFGSAMDAWAWGGWMATKVVLDAVLKTKTSEPCALQRFLVSDGARFDGHKGVSLFFDPQTRQLVQPVYIRRSIGEAEPVAVAQTMSSTDRTARNATNCPATCA
jgi:hypothetical protein